MSIDKPGTRRDDPECTVRALEQAESLRRKGAYAQAREVLGDIIRRGESSAVVYYRLGNTCVDAGDLQSAERAYEKALEQNPAFTNALHNLAVVYRRQGRVSLYVRAIKRSQRMQAGLARDANGTIDGKRRGWRAWRRSAWILPIGLAVGIVLWLILR